MVTMQQIADRCGVSRGTVDRALHHKEGVREEVAERIRATAREMGYISNRLVMQQTQQWKIGVVLHSGHSPFVQMLCELFESFSERELLPNITVIVRAMQDMDVQHQLTLIDELVTTEHIDGLALMPLANTLVRDKINTLSEQQGIPVVTLNTDITDANRASPMSARTTSRAAAPPPRCSVWSCRGTAACCQFWGSAAVTMPTRSVLPASSPKWRRVFRISGFCTRNARSSMKAFPSASLCAPFSRTASCAASI